MTRRLIVVLLGILAALALAPPSQAAGHTVTLSPNGPGPSALTIAANDTVTFKAGDANTYHVRRTAGSWTFDVVVTSSKPVTTKPFGTGTYGYRTTFDTVLGESPSSSGSIVVPTKATPSPTTSPTSKPSASATSRPSASPSPSAGASASVTASGVAVPPPITGGIIPTPDPSTSTGPQPQVAPTAGGLPTATASPTPLANASFADPSTIVQKSTHGFGLPVALAVVGVVGVVTLLVRFLLAAPEAQRPVG